MMHYWMYGYSPAHWIWFIVMVAVVLYPAGRILNRLGFSPLWSILVFCPDREFDRAVDPRIC